MRVFFDQVWQELRAGLANAARCPQHPEFPCVYTLARLVPNDIVEITEDEVAVRSHDTYRIRRIPRERFQELWDALASAGSARFRTGNNGSVVGAIYVRCLSIRVAESGRNEIRLK